MNKIALFTMFLAFAFFSCKDSEVKNDRLEIAKQYYRALDTSDGLQMKGLLSDSLVVKQTEYDYEQAFTKEEYIGKWLKWDSVFHPTYEVLEIEQQSEIVKVKISKLDKRIFFLHGKPYITNETIKFQKDKISVVEVSDVNFDAKTWERNRSELLKWVDENHPELDGFIFDQTKSGGLKYLKVMQLYQKKTDVSE